MAGTALYLGQLGADADDGARLWRLASGSDDDGTAFDISALSNWIRPFSGQSTGYSSLPASDAVFYDAYVTITWSMAVVLRFTPILDESPDSELFTPAMPLGGSLVILEPELTLAPPDDGRTTQTFRIPLMRKVLDAAGVEQGRNYLVGTRLRFGVTSVGGLGAGDLILDGVEIEVESVDDAYPSNGEG